MRKVTEIDLLLCVATYRSSKFATQMIESLHHIDGNVLCFITGAKEDTELHDIPTDHDNVIIAQSDRNCAAFNQAWGLVWAINNNINPRYVCFIDDDVEFTKNSENIIRVVESAEPFSLVSLGNSACLYKKGQTNVSWVDDCGMFVKFEDCVNCGVRDSQPEASWIFYTGIEYQHRLRYLTGKSTVAIYDNVYYKHHQRIDNNHQKIRSENEPEAFHYASRFWKDKFGIDMKIDPIGNANLWYKLRELCISPEYNRNFKKHLVFDGEWVDWKKIYNSYSVEIL